jgi:hypothetical protein
VTSHGRVRASEVLMVTGVLVLVLAHTGALFYGASRMRLPIVIIGGVLVLMVATHRGVVSKVRGALRDRARRR